MADLLNVYHVKAYLAHQNKSTKERVAQAFALIIKLRSPPRIFYETPHKSTNGCTCSQEWDKNTDPKHDVLYTTWNNGMEQRPVRSRFPPGTKQTAMCPIRTRHVPLVYRQRAATIDTF